MLQATNDKSFATAKNQLKHAGDAMSGKPLNDHSKVDFHDLSKMEIPINNFDAPSLHDPRADLCHGPR